MKYLHTMVRVTDVEASLKFYCEGLGLEEVRRHENDKGRYTLIFLRAPGDAGGEVELTYNWDPEEYTGGRNFGHLAYRVKDIYALCQHLSLERRTSRWSAFNRHRSAIQPHTQDRFRDPIDAVIDAVRDSALSLGDNQPGVLTLVVERWMNSEGSFTSSSDLWIQ